MEKLQERLDEKVKEIQADYKQHYTSLLVRENLKTADDVCNSVHILQVAFAFEVSEHIINKLQNNEEERYEDLDEIMVLLLETSNVMDWIMDWYDEKEYCPDITSGSGIDDWLLGCLEDYQALEG